MPSQGSPSGPRRRRRHRRKPKKAKESPWVRSRDIPKYMEPMPAWEDEVVEPRPSIQPNLESWERKDGCPELRDWDGNWAPAPLDWELREKLPYSSDKVSKWIDESWNLGSDYWKPLPLVHIPEIATIASFTDNGRPYEPGAPRIIGPDCDLKIVVIDQMVPRYWVPDDIEQNLDANTYWEYAKTRPPECYDEEDQEELVLGHKQPWWEKFPDLEACYLLKEGDDAREVGIDVLRESPADTKHRLADKGSEAAARAFRKKASKRAAERRRMEAEDGDHTHTGPGAKVTDVGAGADGAATKQTGNNRGWRSAQRADSGVWKASSRYFGHQPLLLSEVNW